MSQETLPEGPDIKFGQMVDIPAEQVTHAMQHNAIGSPWNPGAPMLYSQSGEAGVRAGQDVSDDVTNEAPGMPATNEPSDIRPGQIMPIPAEQVTHAMQHNAIGSPWNPGAPMLYPNTSSQQGVGNGTEPRQ